MPPEAIEAGCADIASQLVEIPYGDGFEVAMGGGRANFLPATAADPEDEGKKGKRKDGKDLTQAWLDRYSNSGAYVWNMEQYDAIDPPSNVDHVLGLFEILHMEHDYDRPKDKAGEPYTTIGFANGPRRRQGAEGAQGAHHGGGDGPGLHPESLVPLPSETHGGEDLGIYAIGPWSHLFPGVVEENYTFHVMDYASKISERAKAAGTGAAVVT